MTERRELIASLLSVDPALIAFGLDGGGLDVGTADVFIENAIGTRAFAYAVLPSVLINGREYVVPMVVDVNDDQDGFVASLARAADLVNDCGGIRAELVGSSTMVAQVELRAVQNLDDAIRELARSENEIVDRANASVPSLVARGCGARRIVSRPLAPDVLVVHVHVDCGDAMGANLVNTVAEAVAPRLAEIARGQIGLRILTNLCDDRRVKASCSVLPPDVGESHLEQIAKLGMYDPSFAEAHNVAVMRAIDGLAIATGNDWRALSAGVHAFAARDGAYRAVASWSSSEGSIDIPLALGVVGGTLRAHRAAQLSLRILGVDRASDLAMVAAGLGLLSSFAFVADLKSD